MLLDQPRLQALIASLPAEAQHIANQMVESLRVALSSSLTTVFLSAALVMTAALFLAFFLKEIPLRTSNRVAPEEPERKSTRELRHVDFQADLRNA